MFSQIVCQGRRQTPPGSPMAIMTYFGWLLSGTIRPNGSRHRDVCLSSVIASDENWRSQTELIFYIYKLCNMMKRYEKYWHRVKGNKYSFMLKDNH